MTYLIAFENGDKHSLKLLLASLGRREAEDLPL